MGFFSDLKEDLSQAVSELMPEEAIKEEALDKEQEQSMSELEQTATEQVVEADTVETAEESLDITNQEELEKLDEMLQRVDSIEIAMEETEEEPDLETSFREAFGEKEENEGDEKKMEVQTKTVADETAVITAGMTITGDVNSEGSLELIGTINGNVSILGKLNITGTITGNSKAAEIFADNAKITGEVVSEGSVKIGPSSVVIGNISANSAVIAGAVKGDIDVHGPVILDASAIVMGNIKSKAVQINNGAVIEGMCSQCYADVNPTSFFDDYKKGKKNK